MQARIATATAEHAVAAAAHLPARHRQNFLDHLRTTGETTGTPGSDLLPDLPTGPSRQMRQLAVQAAENGLTQATKETLIPLIAVLVLGTLAGAAMRRTAPTPAGTSQPETRLPLTTTKGRL
ncbi:hypothetical protein ACFXP3_13665 [Streptomyces sp. NPDC059096]|uniref:hypothetical protein n=1 Tax=Streptomyces sp. NPDC059096 TaxID=3346727 RepID=UPI0036C3DF3B